MVSPDDKNLELPSTATGSAEHIAARLQDAILNGRYIHGERLPAERQLAEHFGASRGTIREALRRLENQRLLVRRVGSGTFVNYRPKDEAVDISDRTSPIELIDARLALEPTICRLAAINATGRDLKELETALQALECAHDRESFSAADESFHMILAECTHNPLLTWLYRFTNEVRSHEQWSLMKSKILDQSNIDSYNAQHRNIYEALCRRDVDQAVAAMRQHLKKARDDLVGAQED